MSAVNLPVQPQHTMTAAVSMLSGQQQKTAAGGGGVTTSNSSCCECPMCYHSIKNPCAECGCPTSSMSKVKADYMLDRLIDRLIDRLRYKLIDRSINRLIER